MKSHRQAPSPSRQSGAVLLVAVVLLLLAGLMTLFALNVGLFEQRSTGNDLRAKAVNEVAEAGLAQGFEYLMRQNADMLDDTAAWEPCGATDETFPCGAISAGLIDTDGDGTADTARRSTMYRLRATSNTIAGLDNAMAQYMLPLASSSKLSTTANGSQVVYGVAPVACFIQRPPAPDPAPPAPPFPILCGNGAGAGATALRAVTFVSVAKMPGESASATLVQTIGQYPKLGDLIGLPPITASGSAGVSGTLQIVTNPNGGGTGVPVSVWNRVNIAKTGTTNTCYADEFFRYTQGSSTPVPYQGTIRCDDCRCDANGAPTTLSYDNSGSLQVEGIDVLDVDAGTTSATGYQTGGHVGANYNVRADALSFPVCEFPPDLFDFVFNAPTWSDTNSDCFAETKRPKVLYVSQSGASAMVDPDESWLYKNADRIIGAPNPSLLNPGQAGTSALLESESTSGIIWCHQDCDIGSGEQVGTVAAPVILVLDGPVSIQGIVFGLVFIRDPVTHATNPITLDPTSGSATAGNCPNNCMLQMNAGAAVYGAVVMQGQMNVNGTSAVIYDASVLAGLIGDNNIQYATLPGAWNDQRSY